MRSFFIFPILLIFHFSVFAQYTIQKPDSLYSLQRVNDTLFYFHGDTINELWFMDKSADSWQLGKSTEIRTFYNNSFRLLIQKNKYSLWKFNREIDDWENTKTFVPEKFVINDTLSYKVINDSTKLVEISDKQYSFKTIPYIYVYDRSENLPDFIVNDTIELRKINDTLILWACDDSTLLWYPERKPKIWKVSNSTIVWTLNKNTEFWKSGSEYSIWNVKDGGGWEKSDKKPLHYIVPMNLWIVNDSLTIIVKNDSVSLWKPYFTKKIWKLRDSILVWQINKPILDTIDVDTIEKNKKQVKQADLMNFENIKIWSLSDKIKVWEEQNYAELLFRDENARLWKINDSSLIWSIGEDTKVSFMSDTVVVWHKNDTTFEWYPDYEKKLMQVSDSLRVMQINDTVRFSVLKDSTSIWNALISTVITTKSKLRNFYMINDSTELWEVNDTIKLWIGKYAGAGDVWQKNKRVNILNINDSTKIWQINEQFRLSIINNRLKVWQQGGNEPAFPWRELNNDLIIINDSIRIWPIDEKTIIWETRKKIEVWNKNSNEKLYRLTDTSLVWTFSANNQALVLKKPIYWTWGGTGKVDVSQAYLQNWVKGGESSISMLFIINLLANYNKRKVKWDNSFEYRFGILKSGIHPLRKNNDKIKIQSIFNYYAKDKWYYSLSSSIETQIFKGYNYKSDTIQELVSIFSGPLYTQLALGMNYYPFPQLSIFFSPLTHKLTYVRDTSIIDQTIYGIDKDKNQKNEPGAIVKTVLNWQINPNIHLLNRLDFFTNYSHNPQNVDVDWQLTLTFKLSKILNTTLTTHLIYDDDINIPKYNQNGEKIGEGPAVQFKEILSIGFFYQFQ